jgi:N-acetylmuramoyl-L-alanine amidase-like protein
MTWLPPEDARWFPKAERHELPTDCLVGRWKAQPIGVIEHFTAGCQDPYNTLVEKGFGVLAVVHRDGSVVQFQDTTHWSWHARGASPYYFGVEHIGYPTKCDLTVDQLEASAELTAWILGTVLGWKPEDVQRSFGISFTPGLKAHFDGLEDAPVWDICHHWDGIWKADVTWLDANTRASLNRSPWTATQYMDKVREFMGGEDVDEVQDTMLRRDWFFRAALADALGVEHPDTPEEDAEDVIRGWSTQTAKELVALLKKAAAPAHVPPAPRRRRSPTG